MKSIIKNYYQTLNVNPDALKEEIDAAYERLLDLREKFPAAFDEDRIQNIDEAYDILGDTDKRKRYDMAFWQATGTEKYTLSSGIRHKRWKKPRESARQNMHVAYEILMHLLPHMAVGVMVLTAGVFAVISGESVSINPSGPTSTFHRIVTVTKGVVPSPQAVQPTFSPAAEQYCLVRSRNDQPLQLFAEDDDAAHILDTIEPGIPFFGIWHAEWFEFDDSIQDLPQHGFVRQADLVAITCY